MTRSDTDTDHLLRGIDDIETRLNTIDISRKDAEKTLTHVDTADIRSALLELLSNGWVTGLSAKTSHDRVRMLLQQNPIDRSCVPFRVQAGGELRSKAATTVAGAAVSVVTPSSSSSSFMGRGRVVHTGFALGSDTPLMSKAVGSNTSTVPPIHAMEQAPDTVPFQGHAVSASTVSGNSNGNRGTNSGGDGGVGGSNGNTNGITSNGRTPVTNTNASTHPYRPHSHNSRDDPPRRHRHNHRQDDTATQLDAPVSQLIHRDWDPLHRNRLLVIRHVYLHHRETILTNLFKKWRRMRSVFLQHDAVLPILETSVSHLDDNMTRFVSDQIVCLKTCALEQAARIVGVSAVQHVSASASSTIPSAIITPQSSVTSTPVYQPGDRHGTHTDIINTTTPIHTPTFTQKRHGKVTDISQLGFTSQQNERLEQCYRNGPKCSKVTKKRLAESTGLTLSDIDLWFHCRRGGTGIDTTQPVEISMNATDVWPAMDADAALSILTQSDTGHAHDASHALNNTSMNGNNMINTSINKIVGNTDFGQMGLHSDVSGTHTPYSIDDLATLITLNNMCPLFGLGALGTDPISTSMTNVHIPDTGLNMVGMDLLSGLDLVSGFGLMPDVSMSHPLALQWMHRPVSSSTTTNTANSTIDPIITDTSTIASLISNPYYTPMLFPNMGMDPTRITMPVSIATMSTPPRMAFMSTRDLMQSFPVMEKRGA